MFKRVTDLVGNERRNDKCITMNDNVAPGHMIRPKLCLQNL